MCIPPMWAGSDRMAIPFLIAGDQGVAHANRCRSGIDANFDTAGGGNFGFSFADFA
jgi:hypothetical protein